MSHKMVASFLLTLIYCSTIQAMNEAEFKQALTNALQASTLTATQKAKHILNRMAYGGNPLSSKQRLNKLNTNEKLIAFIVEQFKNANAPVPTNTIADEIFASSFHYSPEAACEFAKQNKNEANIYNYCREGLYDFKDFNAGTDIQKKYNELTAQFNAAKTALDQAKARKENAAVIKDLTEKFVTARMNFSGLNGRSFGALKYRQAARAMLDEDRAFRYQLFDFWFNHFNVSVEKIGGLRLRPYISVIEQNMTGSFHDLLSATAHSPGMLMFLDNFVSGQNRNRIINQAESEAMARCRPGTPGGIPACVRRVVRQVLQKNVVVNENYARELIELHTFGEGPGLEYGQNAVERSAEILSGWTIKGDQFFFNPDFHVRGNKNLFINPNITILDGGPSEAGQSEGENLLSHLADHPATAENISKKLVRRFVSEDSAFTAPLINRMKKMYLDSDGNLSQLYQMLFTSPEFWSPKAYRSKAVRPFDNHVRMTRAMGLNMAVTPNVGQALQNQEKSSQIDRLRAIAINVINRSSGDGQNLFSCMPPTGFADDNNIWGSVGSVFSNAVNGFRLEEVAFNQKAYTSSYPGFGSNDPKIGWLWRATNYYFLDTSPFLSNSNSGLQPSEEINVMNNFVNRFDSELLTGRKFDAPNIYKVPIFDQIKTPKGYYLLPVRTQLSLHFGSEEASRY